NNADLGPAQQTEAGQDVSPESLPGKYTVKEGDTLFTIADKYYQDGYQYTELAKANNLTNENLIEAGQVLEIPKLDIETQSLATGGGNTTIWGPKIEGNTYTVVEGDWLSKIAGRAYGDIMAFDKIAKANNIQNPDLIEPGMVLTIPDNK
ncbi:MAG: LysM domain-containing protein, partial [Patescibacteria group bacterium]